MIKKDQAHDFLLIGAQEPISNRLEGNSNVFKGIPPYFTPYGRDFMKMAARAYSFPAYAIPVLAACIRGEGASVKCVNDFYSEARGLLAGLVKNTGYGVVISTTFLTGSRSILDIIDFVRGINPSVKVLLGGPGIINFPNVRKYSDVNIFYEGEATIAELTRILLKRKDISKVKGISYFKVSKEVSTGNRPQITDLADIPLPYWKGMTEIAKEEKYLPIESSRGCVGKCSFCFETKYWPEVRFYPIDRVIRELRDSISGFGIRFYYFQDSNISNSKNYLTELCDAIRKERLDIVWGCESRIDTLTKELVDRMYGAGCIAITFGMESADPVILRNMNKRVTKKKMEAFADLVRYLRKRGMIANINVIVGFPGEDNRSVRRTIDFLRYSKPMVYSMSKFFLEKGTDIWNRRKEFSLEGCMYDWKHDTMKSSELDPIIRRIFLEVSKDGDICHWTSATVDLVRHMAKGKSLKEFVKYLKAVNRICVEDLTGKGRSYSAAYDASFRYISGYLA